MNMVTENTSENNGKYAYLKEYLERCQRVTDEHDKHLLKSDLDMKIPLQMLKIFEEAGEIQKALLSGNVTHAIKECNDLILTGIVMQEKLNQTPDNIMVNMELELQKCESRIEERYGVKLTP